MSRSVPKAVKPNLKIREDSPEHVRLDRFNESWEVSSIEPEFSFDDVMIHNDIFSGNESLHGDPLDDVPHVHESVSAVPRSSVSELEQFIDKFSDMDSCKGLQTDLSTVSAIKRLPQPSSIVSSIGSAANIVRTGVVNSIIGVTHLISPPVLLDKHDQVDLHKTTHMSNPEFWNELVQQSQNNIH